jgi:hypothetical protein
MNNKIPSIADIERLIGIHEKYKNCYFWKDNGNSKQRSLREALDSSQWEFEYYGDKYRIVQDITLSRNNAYYSLAVYRNDKKKDIRALKGLVLDILENELKKVS